MRSFKYGDLKGKSLMPRKIGIARVPNQVAQERSHRKVASESRYGIDKLDANMNETLQIVAIKAT